MGSCSTSAILNGSMPNDSCQRHSQLTFILSVMLEGHMDNPSGTLSGGTSGSVQSRSGVLIQVQELLEAKSRLNEAKKRQRGRHSSGTWSLGDERTS